MVLLDLSKRLRGLKSPTTENVFEAMVCSIVEQQISLILAHKMEEKIIKAFGDVLNLRDGTYYAFPTSQRLAAAKIAQLRKCGLSSRKSEYIRDVAKLIVDKKLNLEKFKISGDVGEIISELCKIRGVGVWTAEMTILRGLRRLENIPADDVSLQRCISHFYFGGRRISSEELRKLAENWGKWKGLVGFYLVIAEIMDKVRD